MRDGLPTELAELLAADYNPRTADAPTIGRLGESLASFGDLGGIVWNRRSGRLVGGHQRLRALKGHAASLRLRHDGAQVFLEATVVAGDQAKTRDFAVRVVDWPDEVERAANVAANAESLRGRWDLEALDELLGEVRVSLPDVVSVLRLEDPLAGLTLGAPLVPSEGSGGEGEARTPARSSSKRRGAAPPPDEADPPAPVEVPHAVWPGDPQWGIPVLLEGLQGLALDMPATKWGTRSRKDRGVGGLVHFYTDDYKFEAVWQNPAQPVDFGSVSVTEPNFSTTPRTPAAVVLGDIYRKRWLARFWQAHGVRIWVDLYVEEAFRDLNFLGVPKGWKAYSVRGKEGQLDTIRERFEWASAHAGGAEGLRFLIIGGSGKVAELAAELGAFHVPQSRQVVSTQR